MNTNGDIMIDPIAKDAFIAALKDGSLTADSISSRLKDIVEHEIAKDKSDFELIQICEDLLWEINAPLSLTDDKEDSKRTFMDKLNRQSAVKRRSNPISHKFAFAAAMIVFFTCVGIYGSQQWLSGHSSSDEQQFVVSGTKIDQSIIQTGSAEVDRSELREISTTNFEEICQFLGHTPPLISHIPNEMQLEYYSASTFFVADDFFAVYSSNEGTYINYSFTRYHDAETASVMFEQDEHGQEIKVNSTTVYYSTNIDTTVCIWLDGLNCYYLDSNILTVDILELIEKNILKGRL